MVRNFDVNHLGIKKWDTEASHQSFCCLKWSCWNYSRTCPLCNER